MNRGPDSSDVRLLKQLARCHGIQSSYFDMAGKRHEAQPETLKALLPFWNTSGDHPRQLLDALREHEARYWREVLPPVMVAWDTKPTQAFLRLRQDRPPTGERLKLHYEDGQVKTIVLHCDRLHVSERAKIAGRNYSAQALRLPPLPFGYHSLELEIGDRIHRSLIISAPRHAFSPVRHPGTGPARLKSTAPPSTAGRWGLFLPLYAAHSRQSWGAGNIGDWRNLGDWLASSGGHVMATLPMCAAFMDSPIWEASPYSPASRLFWNEFYLDILHTPEFTRCPAAQTLVQSSSFVRAVKGFQESRWIDYRAQMNLRRQVLERLAKWFRRSNSPRHQQFETFVRNHPRLNDYAEFRAACEQLQKPWQRWDERLRYGKLQAGDFSDQAKHYHLYVQWLAHEQMTHFKDWCCRRRVEFYLDLPLGVHPESYDVWRERDAFAFPASVGAPPDMFFAKGQNWGFPPLNPERLRAQGYRHFLDYLRFQMRCTGLLRIDHIMGFHRLYWIPPGFPPTQGAYVTYPAEELHALLSLESHRHKTILVGENLGTVPPEVDAAMAKHHLRETYVLQYQTRLPPGPSLHQPPVRSVASLNTHDMPTFAAHWRGLDLEDRVALGLLPARDVPKQMARRKKMNTALLDFLKRKGWLDSEKILPATALRACLKWLAASPAETLLFNLEDLWLEQQPQNVPGTSFERPNWRQKARLSIEQIRRSAELRELLRTINELRGDGRKAGGEVTSPPVHLQGRHQ